MHASAREHIEELEETIRQQKELLTPAVSLKLIGLSPQESKFVMCLLSSPTRIRTDAQLTAAITGLDNENIGDNHLKVLKSHITKKIGDKIQIFRVRDIGYELGEASTAWLKTVVEDLARNQHSVYSLKRIMMQHVGEKRPLSHWNHTYPGALPYKLPPTHILMLEAILAGPVSLKEIEAVTGMGPKTARTAVHHLITRSIPPQYVLRHGSTRTRTYSINPQYRAELIAGFATWWEKFRIMYDVEATAG